MSATTSVHASEAKSLVRQSAQYADTTPDLIALAQVHATLALVEQQRIANRLALSNITERWAAVDGVPTEILEGLGLA